MQCKTPVAFIIFKRPDTTERVFQEIRRARPPKLLVIADGPRHDRAGEAERCNAARAIIERVDWNCEVLTNYADVNLGCRRRISSGLDWVFDTVEEAIILEDDCLPHPSFFRYCDELLERYRDDERIFLVGGSNYQFGRKRTAYSYYFSRYNHIWGWASWRRAWRYYDVTMETWPEVCEGGWLNDLFDDVNVVKYWREMFGRAHAGQIDTWDFQWTFTCWIQNGLSILPNMNLISNIGFSAEATHTTDILNRLANMPVEAMEFPLRHPPFMIRDARADSITQNSNFNSSSKSVMGKFKKLLRGNGL